MDWIFKARHGEPLVESWRAVGREDVSVVAVPDAGAVAARGRRADARGGS